MNKGRRNEITQLKFKKRLINLGFSRLTMGGKLHAFKSDAKPCSCWSCQPDGKYRENLRAKNKAEIFREIHLQ